MKKTRFMSKLFSDTEYQEKISAKMDEARENGSASLEEDGENLQFADVEGDIIVEDKTDGMSEVTRISPNPDDDNDFVVSAVEVPAEFSEEETIEETPAEEPEEKTVTESDNLASIEISRIPGKDGEADDIVDDLEIEVETGITDDEKSGTNAYSLKFKNYSKKRAQMFAKIFSECADCFDEVVKSANVDEDVQVKFEDGEMKVMSVTFGKKARTFSEGEEKAEEKVEEKAEEAEVKADDEPNTDLTEIIDSANKLAEMADNGITKENAEEVKNLAEEIINKAEAAENDEVSLMSIKKMCSMFSEEAAKVADEETPEETPAEEVEKAAEEQVAEEEETKVESNASPTVMQCPETGKWFIQEDPEKKLYDTQEEAEQVAAKSFCGNKEFSDPKVTVTIEDLEPASVGDLLGYKKEEEEPKKEEDELKPAVDPNEGGTGRQFSMTTPKKSVNPLLFTEIN